MCKTPDFSIRWGDLGELKNGMSSPLLPVELELKVLFIHLQAHGIGKWIRRCLRSSSSRTINQTTLCICRTIETEGKRHFTNKHRLEIRTRTRAHIFPSSRVLQFIYRTKTSGEVDQFSTCVESWSIFCWMVVLARLIGSCSCFVRHRSEDRIPNECDDHPRHLLSCVASRRREKTPQNSE